MPADCIFCKIIQGQIKSDQVYHDDQAVAIRDINPKAPVHILVIPIDHITSVAHVEQAQEQLLGHLLVVARKVAELEGVSERGFRLIVNCGQDGGMEVSHLHIHVLGGRPLGPMLCKHA
ncbi:MAG: histidine triad nucleotide-binding protein [Chloroflexi bacterium]|nr:histidine triad nucleotide-binding protein [Chloroflexota bacterium]